MFWWPWLEEDPNWKPQFQSLISKGSEPPPPRMLHRFVPRLMAANEFHLLKTNDDSLEPFTAISDFLPHISVDVA
jgi:hypothetical protein